MYVKPMGLCYSLFLLRMFFNLASPAECIFPELLFFSWGTPMRKKTKSWT